MAARKKPATSEPLAPFSPPNTVRSFAHPDGRTYSIQLLDCRIYESWTNADHGGGSNASTRNSNEEALSFAWGKVKGLLKKGYLEGASRAGRVWDATADVVAVLRSNLDYKGDPRCDLQPVAHRPNVFLARNISVDEWLVTSDDRRRAILLVCTVWESKQAQSERDAMASVLLDLLVAMRDEILADAATPVRKLALAAPVGRFTHLVILSPTVENHLVDGKFTVSRSIHRAFPAFDCEMSEADTVTVAEARTEGHASLPYARWDRAPHPIVDIAYLKDPSDAPTFLVYDPRQMEQRLGGTLSKLNGVEVRARNYRGVVRSFFKDQTPPDHGELRRFFGFEA